MVFVNPCAASHHPFPIDEVYTLDNQKIYKKYMELLGEPDPPSYIYV